MPSADSRCAVISPCGLITHWFLSPAPSVCLSCIPGSSLAGTPSHLMPGIFFYRFSPIFRYLTTIVPLRHSGPPGVSLGCFQRTIVRYTWADHVTDIGLYPVLRTRPGLPQPHLPALYLIGTGHTCTSTHAFVLGFLQAHIAGTPLPSTILRLHQPGSGLCSGFVSIYLRITI